MARNNKYTGKEIIPCNILAYGKMISYAINLSNVSTAGGKKSISINKLVNRNTFKAAVRRMLPTTCYEIIHM